MAKHGGFPKWFLDSKEDVCKKREWEELISELHDAIEQQLKESHIDSFTDLTDPERTLMIERAAKSIKDGVSFKELFGRVSRSLDQHLNNHVAGVLQEDEPTDTKTDLVLENAEEGAIALLRKWPDMRSKLHVCFNQPLPKELRQLAWKLFMENSKFRKAYVALLSSNPRSAISTYDLQISQHCEYVLQSSPLFQHLNGSMGIYYGMKAMLSYYHAQSGSPEQLSEPYYMLAIPFVHVNKSKLSRTEPPSGPIVALLAEEFYTFITTRPKFMIQKHSQSEALRTFTTDTVSHLSTIEPELSHHLAKCFVQDKDKIIETEAGVTSLIADGLIDIIEDLVVNLFVGKLHMDVVTYIWDQYMIGSDVPGFNQSYLSVVTAVHLALLADKFKTCDTESDLQSIIDNDSGTLHTAQFQYLINKHFYKNLFPRLTSADDVSTKPVLDPTQATYKPWTHWFSGKIPPYTTSNDRAIIREERENEREKQRGREREMERIKQQEQQKIIQDQHDKKIEKASKQQQKVIDEKIALEKRLQDERRRRIENERQSAAELERLRREIEELKRQPKLPETREETPTSLLSLYPLPPPPNTAATKSISTPIDPLTPRPFTPTRTTEEMLSDLLKSVADAQNHVGHGENENAKELNKETTKSLNEHVEFAKVAEMKAFGRHLKDQEFSQFPPEDQQRYGTLLMNHIKKQYQRKYQQDHKPPEDRQRGDEL